VQWLSYGLDDCGSIPGRRRDFFFSPLLPDWLWSAASVKLTTHPHLAPRLGVRGAIPPVTRMSWWYVLMAQGQLYLYYKSFQTFCMTPCTGDRPILWPLSYTGENNTEKCWVGIKRTTPHVTRFRLLGHWPTSLTHEVIITNSMHGVQEILLLRRVTSMQNIM